MQQHATFEALEAFFKRRISDAYDGMYLCNLHNNVLGFSHVTVADMLKHLRNHCLAINDVDRAMKLQQVHVRWDTIDNIYTFFTNIKLAAQDLEDNYDIIWPEKMKLIHAVDAMYKSGSFTKAEKVGWENKDEANKTWVHLQSYFGDLWDADQKFLDLMAEKEGYGEGMNNIKEGPALAKAEGSVIDAMKEIAIAATADIEHIQQMSTTADNLLTVLKQQQTTIKRQQTTIKGLTSQISQLIKQNGELAKSVRNSAGNNSNPQPRGGNKGRYANRRGGGPTREENNDEPQECPKGNLTRRICGPDQWHVLENCRELDKNKDNRPDGWVSKIE